MKRAEYRRMHEPVRLASEQLDRARILDGEPDAFYWCLHCERVYPADLVRLVKQGRKVLQMCPYEGCDGDVVFDAWPWERVREVHPEYPELPLRGVVYPMY